MLSTCGDTGSVQAITYGDDSLKRNFSYSFFLSPGDDLNFFADAKQADFAFKITGNGSKNNQPLVRQIKDEIDLQSHYDAKDSLPNNVFASIQAQDIINHKTLSHYIAVYHPSNNFIMYYSFFVQYFPYLR